MLSQVKPQKGKAFENLPKKTLDIIDDTRYLQSTKYDGNQIFIVKQGRAVNFYTSDWKPFHLELVERELYLEDDDFMLIGEFMHGCKGKLGDRRKSAILTTYRTNYAKQIANVGLAQTDTNIMVFDALEIKGNTLITNVSYRDRILYATSIVEDCDYIHAVDVNEVTGRDAKAITDAMISKGWEGTMIVEPDSHYEIGKRVNHSIKLKGRKTADLQCVGVEEGEGKYEGMIGSLVLRDSEGRTVSVGSGLDDTERSMDPKYFLGKIVEIEYEQIMDTYIQPTFVCVRLYKKEID